MLVSLECVDCSPTAHNLTKLIVKVVNFGGGLDFESIACKLISFGFDSALALQSARGGVTMQVKEKHALLMTGVHCVAYWCNLEF